MEFPTEEEREMDERFMDINMGKHILWGDFFKLAFIFLCLGYALNFHAKASTFPDYLLLFGAKFVVLHALEVMVLEPSRDLISLIHRKSWRKLWKLTRRFVRAASIATMSDDYFFDFE